MKIETNRSENSTAKLTLLKKSRGLPPKRPGNREKTLSLFFSPTRLSHEPLLRTTGSSYEKIDFTKKGITFSLAVEVGQLDFTNAIVVKQPNVGHSSHCYMKTLLSRTVVHAYLS